LLHEVLPSATILGLLINPTDPALANAQLKDFLSAARLKELRASGLVISTDPFFTSRPEKLAQLATRYAIPAISKGREFAAAGGLLSYGSDTADSYRLAGIYTGRVLKGEKPADLPVQQARWSCSSI